MNHPPQYNPNPNVPIGQPSNMQLHQQQMQYPQQHSQQHPQQHPQQRPKHYVFFQPRCKDSGEFFKLLQFSQVLNSQFQRIDVTVPGQKVPPNVQSTPSIAIYPDYKIKNPNDSFRWLQQAIIYEQRRQNPTNQPHQQMRHPGGGEGGNGGFPAPQRVDRPGNMGRVNMPVYNPDIGEGGQHPNMQSNPSGKEPSQHFNTYDPNRDTVRPFMSDMDSHGGGGFAYLNTSQPPPCDYAHIPNQHQQQGGQQQGGQMQTHMGPNGQPTQPGRPQKLPENQYQAYLQSRSQDPYIQQQMPQSF